jgi:hypothetical protein
MDGRAKVVVKIAADRAPVAQTQTPFESVEFEG